MRMDVAKFYMLIETLKETACPHFKAKKEKEVEAETTVVAGEN